MQRYPLKITEDGYVFISHDDRLDPLVDELVKTDYSMEFCLALDFNPRFINALMRAGFLVMSSSYRYHPLNFILLPKLHLVRSVLFFKNLHIKKSVKRLLSRYELRFDADFDIIVEKCVEKHGDDWLTTPLLESMWFLHGCPPHGTRPRPVSFGLYRDGVLKAGEFGILAGGVYTSYSGYYEEDNAGTVQMILMARYLEERGADLLDFGMPLPYKDDLGAENVSPRRFVELFRERRDTQLPLITRNPA
jgi:Leu/Phe-tRNA-protein transferase